MASSHRNVGRFLAINIACANSNSVRLNLSATPFWDGEYGAVVSKVIPLSAVHFFISSLINSFPLSILIHFGHLPNCRCIFVRCSLIFPVASLFCFINRTLPCRVQSSTNEMYHFHFPMDSTLAGPHTSDITLSPGSCDLFSTSFGQGLRACFACMQASHVFDGIID